jgi:hypothetical protein
MWIGQDAAGRRRVIEQGLHRVAVGLPRGGRVVVDRPPGRQPDAGAGG